MDVLYLREGKRNPEPGASGYQLQKQLAFGKNQVQAR